MHLGPGHPYPLGATWDGAGVFALFSAHAWGVDLCLFDAPESPMTAAPATDRMYG